MHSSAVHQHAASTGPAQFGPQRRCLFPSGLRAQVLLLHAWPFFLRFPRLVFHALDLQLFSSTPLAFPCMKQCFPGRLHGISTLPANFGTCLCGKRLFKMSRKPPKLLHSFPESTQSCSQLFHSSTKWFQAASRCEAACVRPYTGLDTNILGKKFSPTNILGGKRFFPQYVSAHMTRLRPWGCPAKA